MRLITLLLITVPCFGQIDPMVETETKPKPKPATIKHLTSDEISALHEVFGAKMTTRNGVISDWRDAREKPTPEELAALVTQLRAKRVVRSRRDGILKVARAYRQYRDVLALSQAQADLVSGEDLEAYRQIYLDAVAAYRGAQ